MRSALCFSLGLAAAVGLASLTGCGGKARSPQGKVTGTIKYKGQPVNAAGLQLFSTTNSTGSPDMLLPVTQEGTFGGEIPPGTYKVVVEVATGKSPMHFPPGMDKAKLAEAKAKAEAETKPATIPIPAKYKTLAKTDLTMTVNLGEQTVALELKD